MWNPKGYGSPSTWPVYMDDFNEALVFAWKGDNQGPPTPTEAANFYAQAQAEFPNAKIVASSITNFAEAVLANQTVYNNLELIDQEIGDSWTHGIQADPWKTAINRAAQRERSKCLQSGGCSLDSTAFYNFSRLLLKNGVYHYYIKDDLNCVYEYFCFLWLLR